MRNLAVIVAVGCSATAARAQELIPNPSFEQATGCPVGPGEIALADPWTMPTLGTSDYFNPCNTTGLGTPDNDVGSQAAYGGSSYAGLLALYPALPDYREYIQTPLVGSGLDAGKTYRFSMHLSLAEDSSAATDRIGAYFSTTPVGSGDVFVLPLTPQLETPTGTILDDTVEWMDYSGTFVATGGEQYVTIGNFHGLADSTATPAGSGPAPPLHPGAGYYYIDVVSLMCEPCLPILNGMTAWWTLDEPLPTIANDFIGAHDGVPVGITTPVTGLVAGAREFDGSGISVASTLELEVGNQDFSIDAWVRPDALIATRPLIVKIPSIDPTPSGPGFLLAMNSDGTVHFRMIDDLLNDVSVDSTVALTPGVWSFVAVTVDRENPVGGRLYVEDEVVAFDPTPAMGSLANTLPLHFAQDGGSGVGEDFDGALDEIELFGRALDEFEVTGIHEARTSGKCKVLPMIPPVTVVSVTTGGVIDIDVDVTNDPNSAGGGATGVTGTFAVSARREPAGTTVGRLRSTVNGPASIAVLPPQPVQIAAGETASFRLRMGVPWNLIPDQLACYSVTIRHLETGQEFTTRAMLRGCQRGTPELRR